MGATGTAQTRIDAAPGTVWAMVSDITRMGEWSPETVSCEWLDGATGPAVGARFKGTNKNRATWKTTCEVTVCEPGRRFEFVVLGRGGPETRWTYQFEPAAGGTEVTESFELVKPLTVVGRVLTRVTTGVKDREAYLVDGMRQTLARLKAAAEAS